MFVAKPLRARAAEAGSSMARLATVLLVILAFAACGKKDEADTAGPATAGPTLDQAAAVPADAVSAQVAAMGVDQLRAAASSALREQRLYAPQGNNAMEYYLALRDKAPSDAAIASALTDLLPYALMFGFPVAAIVGLPLALLLAWGLRRVRDQRLHVLVFALAMGAVTTAIMFVLAEAQMVPGNFVIAAGVAVGAAIGRAAVIKMVARRNAQ